MQSLQERKSSITIADIARELGVSKSTVSRVINGKGRIGEETREKVLTCIKMHDYHPNPIAKGLAQKRTYNAAVVIPKDADKGDVPFFQNCLIGITETISRRGYDAMVAIEDGNNDSLLRRLVANHKVDGVVLTRLMEDDKAVSYLQEENIPFVVMGTSSNQELFQVDSDQASGCYDMTSMMIDRGCVRMVVLGGDEKFPVNKKRWQGFKYACELKNIPVDDSNIVWNLTTQEEVSAALPEIIKGNPQCIVCMDDSICTKALNWLKINEFEVPADIQIISFYDSPALENNNPPVTALSVNVSEMSRRAGNLLVDIIEGKDEMKSVKVSYEVKLRESSR